MTVSLCMIVKNEEEILQRSLNSALPLVDEAIIVDTGSDDKTAEIARSLGARVEHFTWIDDFAAARNFAFSRANGDYLLWLDADDFITEENAQRFLSLKGELKRELPDVVMCPYEVISGGKVVLRYLRERLVKRASGFVWQGRVHECIAPKGKILHSEFSVRHLGSSKPRGERNLNIYRKWAKEEPLDGRNLFYYGRELYYHGYYEEAEKTLEGMLCGEGWYVNKIEASFVLAETRKKRNDVHGARAALLTSFLFGEPRARVCNLLADLYHEEGALSEAEYWYQAALICKDHSAEGDFEDENARTLIPLLSLCRISFERNDLKKSYEYHKRAEAIAPDHPSVEYNRNYFSEHPVE